MSVQREKHIHAHHFGVITRRKEISGTDSTVNSNGTITARLDGDPAVTTTSKRRTNLNKYQIKERKKKESSSLKKRNELEKTNTHTKKKRNKKQDRCD